MPLLGFTKLLDKLLDGSKTQTIRKPRKHPIQPGDYLHIYWKLRTKHCRKLGLGVVFNVVRKPFAKITEEEAVKDGFKNRLEMWQCFGEMYPDLQTGDEFDIITWSWLKGPISPSLNLKQLGTPKASPRGEASTASLPNPSCRRK